MRDRRRRDCLAARRGVSSFEVIRSFERLRPARLNVYLAPLLEVAAGPVGSARREQLMTLMLTLQHEEAQKHLRWSSKGLDKAARREDARCLLEGSHKQTATRGDGVSVQELVQVFGPAGSSKPLFDPLSEPYLQLLLGKLQADKLVRLKAAEIPLPDSYNLVILPDFTRSTHTHADPPAMC